MKILEQIKFRGHWCELEARKCSQKLSAMIFFFFLNIFCLVYYLIYQGELTQRLTALLVKISHILTVISYISFQYQTWTTGKGSLK